MAKVSLEKDRIKFLLVEGVHQSTVDNLRAAGYTNIEYHKGALDTESLKGIHPRCAFRRHPIAYAPDRRGVRRRRKLVAVGCFCIGTNELI